MLKRKSRTPRMTLEQATAHQAKVGKPLRLPHKATKKAVSDGYDSNLEREYARRLQALKVTHIIKDWERNTRKFTYCTGHTYTPDFMITNLDGSQIMVELKGFCREDDGIKFDITAEQNPQYRWIFLLKKKGKLVKTRDKNQAVCDIAKELI